MPARKIDGTWYVDVWIKRHGREPKRVRRRSPFQTKAGTERFELALLADVYGTSDRPARTLKAFALDEFRAYALANNRFSEVESKEQILRNHILPIFGEMYLRDIGPREIEAFKAEKMRAGLSPKTVNNHLTVLRKLLSVAHEFRDVAEVPSIRWVKVPPQSFDFFDFEEADRLLAAAGDGFAKTMLLVALRTGLRLGELVALRWDNVDMVAGRIMVRESVTRGRLGAPKNNRVREVPLSPSTVAALKAYRHLRDVVFSQPDGARLTKGETKAPLWRACRKAGLRRVGWHVLRHTFASHLAMRGVPMRTIQELLGHSTMAMTLRYAHLSPAVGTMAVELLDGKNNGPISGHGSASKRAEEG